MRESIVAALESGALVLTPNRRLARRLAIEYCEVQRAKGRAVWESARIEVWHDWLTSLWSELIAAWTGDEPPPLLLSNLQSRELWRQCIEAEGNADALIPTATLAREAAAAWEILHAYSGNVEVLRPPLACSPEIFKSWARRYARRTQEARWLDAARLADTLATRLYEAALPLPRTALLYAFDEISPQRAALLEACAGAGMAWERVSPGPAGGKVGQYEATHPDEEIAFAARWAQTRRRASPSARIGIVVPDLRERRREVLRLLREVLAPSALLAGDEAPGPAFGLSLGAPLTEECLVDAALRLLRLPAGFHALQDIGQLLRAPAFFGDDGESWERSELERRLTEIGVREWSLAQWAQHPLARELTPKLAGRLAEGLRTADRAPPRASPSAWRRQWEEELAAFAWPGEAKLDSVSYQILEAWQKLLDQWVKLDSLCPSLRREDALDSLSRAARDTVFQPEGRGAAIEVLGVLEAAGQRFDALWLCGSTAKVWPGPVNSLAFLPLDWQRAQGVAHATAERELGYARSTLGDFRQAAKEVVFSWARHDGEEPMLASALIADLPAITTEALELAPHEPLAEMLRRRMATEPRHRESGLPVLAHESMTAGLFEAQAECPFQAYARGRLRLAAWPEAVEGLRASERGNLLHRMLESLACALPSSTLLAALGAADETTRIDDAVRLALDELPRERWQALPLFVREAEARRLARLAAMWLAFERQRPLFEVILHETALQTRLAGMPCSLRIDRADRNEDGDEIIIDFKSGALPSKTDWFEDRIAKPQVPLYAVARSGPIAAAVVASLSAEGVKTMGYGADANLFPDLAPLPEKANWSAVLLRWREALETLAAEYRQGVAAVEPRDAPKTCHYCDFKALCRIAENAMAPGETGEGDDDA